MKKIGEFLKNNLVPVMFVIICSIFIPLSGLTPTYIIGEIMSRFSRNSFLILALLIPIVAGMGLNFGMTLGAMAGEIALILVTDWQIWGIPGVVLAAIISVPIAALFGWFCGVILNLAKDKEMVTSYIISYFMSGVYTLIVLYGMGTIIPIRTRELMISRGYGIKSSVNLANMRQCLDNALAIKVAGIKIPVLTLILIALACVFIIWFRKTKLGQDMRAVGQDMEVARSAGINVEKTRIIAQIISAIFASLGMIVYLQNMGNISTYSSHNNVGMFAIAALLVGGASVDKASIGNVFLGVILFHTLFVLSPTVATRITGDSIVGEYFRVFMSYGVIALSLVMYEIKKRKQNSNGKALADAQKEEK